MNMIDYPTLHFNFEHTWWKFFQKCFMHVKLDIYFFIRHKLKQRNFLLLSYICVLFWNSNITSFFRFVNKQAIYRLGIISLAHAPVHVTDFPAVNVHVDELSSAQNLQDKLCATLSAIINLNYRLPIKGYYRICTLRHISTHSGFHDLFLNHSIQFEDMYGTIYHSVFDDHWALISG
jgi:hypothetical protein